MFLESSFNKDITGWKVGKLSQSISQFESNPQFNQDLSVWNVRSACNVGAMFLNATSFNQDMNPWIQKLFVETKCPQGTPEIVNIFKDSGCPLQDPFADGAFCQATKAPSMAPTAPPFRLASCLRRAYNDGDCKCARRRECIRKLKRACETEYLRAGGDSETLQERAVKYFVSRCG
jgi:hypothetical protein